MRFFSHSFFLSMSLVLFLCLAYITEKQEDDGWVDGRGHISLMHTPRTNGWTDGRLVLLIV